MEAVTENELLEELRRALGTDADAFTSTELARAWSVSDATVRRRLRPLIDAGSIVPTRKAATNTHGIMSAVLAYRIAGE
jgi:response regulator of citrate/malate metabolism